MGGSVGPFAREVVHDLELLAADHPTLLSTGARALTGVLGFEPFSHVHRQLRESILQRMADDEQSLMLSQDRP